MSRHADHLTPAVLSGHRSDRPFTHLNSYRGGAFVALHAPAPIRGVEAIAEVGDVVTLYGAGFVQVWVVVGDRLVHRGTVQTS